MLDFFLIQIQSKKKSLCNNNKMATIETNEAFVLYAKDDARVVQYPVPSNPGPNGLYR